MLAVDEIHVQVVVRELDAAGETVAKHVSDPICFLNEKSFRAWAAKPLSFDESMTQPIPPRSKPRTSRSTPKKRGEK